jgi:hypothetical protein
MFRSVLIWIVPLVISFSFYSPDRQLVTSYALFKSVMVVSLTAITLAVNMIRPVSGFSPFVLALVYTLISIVLDLLVVVPMAGLTLGAYVEQIMLVYCIIPALTWSIQHLRQQQATRARSAT